MIEQATELIDENDLGFAFPVPGMMMKHYERGAAPPEWWDQARNLYAGAMVEMYRGKDRSALPGRPMLLYLAKRLEFAFEYLNGVEALAKAGVAKRAGEHDQVVAQLEAAAESIYNALNALAAVARDNSDRGLIAVLNEYGYRPILKEFEAQADAAAQTGK
jgi:predicted ArsR family transcriptional regulator